MPTELTFFFPHPYSSDTPFAPSRSLSRVPHRGIGFHWMNRCSLPLSDSLSLFLSLSPSTSLSSPPFAVVLFPFSHPLSFFHLHPLSSSPPNPCSFLSLLHIPSQGSELISLLAPVKSNLRFSHSIFMHLSLLTLFFSMREIPLLRSPTLSPPFLSTNLSTPLFLFQHPFPLFDCPTADFSGYRPFKTQPHTSLLTVEDLQC